MNYLIIFAVLGMLAPVSLFAQNVEVVGSVKIVDGTQGSDKVLTSDVNGLASWQPALSFPPAIPVYYQSVGICCQSWMTKNLNVDTYRNGDPIPKVEDGGAWAALTTGAYCYFNNDSTTYAAIYGKLYNWYAVNDPRGLAPAGWHIPTDFEWTTTVGCLGGSTVAGGLMKEIGTTHWTSPNTGAVNLSGFFGVGGGARNYLGTFGSIGTLSDWWSATEDDATFAWDRYLVHNNDDAERSLNNKETGFSVRCVRD